MYAADIDKLTITNKNFRRVLYTGGHLQLVVMDLKPGEAIGEEKHDADQFFRIEKGAGTAKVGGKSVELKPGGVLIVPGGMTHNVIAGASGLSLYSLYSPPQHEGGIVHTTKADAARRPRKMYGS